MFQTRTDNFPKIRGFKKGVVRIYSDGNACCTLVNTLSKYFCFLLSFRRSVNKRCLRGRKCLGNVHKNTAKRSVLKHVTKPRGYLYGELRDNYFVEYERIRRKFASFPPNLSGNFKNYQFF